MITSTGTSPGTPGEADVAPLSQSLAANLRRFRLSQGLSVERLSALSGVAREELDLIEQGSGVPTIALLWKVSHALEVPFSSLFSNGPARSSRVLRQADARILTSQDGRFTSRALFPFEGERRAEFYELRLAPDAGEEAEAHAPGTTENLTVVRGTVEIATGDGIYTLGPGDSIQFEADVPHGYRNAGDDEAVLYLVMSYAEPLIS